MRWTVLESFILSKVEKYLVTVHALHYHIEISVKWLGSG
jgi:hypothetical protein